MGGLPVRGTDGCRGRVAGPAGQVRQADLAVSRQAEGVAQDIARNIEQLDLVLRTVIAGVQIAIDPGLTPQQRNTLLAERVPRDRYLAFIDVLDVRGNVVAGLAPLDQPYNWSKQEYFEVLRGGGAAEPYVGRPFAAEHESRVGFTISRRISDGNGAFAGVVVMGVRLGLLRDLFSRHEPGQDDTVALLRDDGLVMAEAPFELKDIGHPIGAAAPFDLFNRTGRALLEATDPADGTARVVAFHQVGTLPLFVSVGTPIAGSSFGPALWWLAAAALALVAAFALLLRRLRRERRRRTAAEHESREKSRFLTTLSHELRTPLHSVLGFAEQLSKDAGPGSSLSRGVTEIVRAVRHMRDTVNLVLDYARIEARGPTLHMRRLDLRQLVDDCMAVVEPGAKARGLALRCVATPGAPAHFVTDEAQLRHVLGNLLHNAVKYTPSGGVELRLAGTREDLTIEVADTGIGIPEGQRHLLFKEFERFGAERTSIEGTGLGLAIANRLVRRLGGHMGYRDNPGGGAIFWFELPASAADEPADASVEPPEVSLRGLRILVVDDSDINRDVAVAFLRNAGHHVSTTHDGDEAVQLVANQDFDVVLMDVLMPGQNGLETTRRIRHLDGPRGRVPIVAVTANALDQQADECRRAGMTEYLAKPFTQDELLAVIARVAAPPRHKSCDHAAVVDADRMAQLVASMGPDAVERLLDCLALRIEALLRALENPVGLIPEDALCSLAHELVGSAGTLGFIELAQAADRFLSAIREHAGGGLAADLRRQALAVQAELRRRRAVEALLPV
jgi:signal transduction histidine kinase/DNA-binding NarL/FixJ family response regulator